jgi:hypothetical protein
MTSTDSFFGKNLVGQDPWERRGENDARIRSLEATLALIQTGAWTSFSPVLTASTTNPTGGTAFVQNGRYSRAGRTINASLRFRFGTSGAAAGSGTYRISLPVTAAISGTINKPIGSGYLYDSSSGQLSMALAYLDVTLAGTDLQILSLTDSGGPGPGGTAVVTNSAPWTWANNDELNFYVTYEAAS